MRFIWFNLMPWPHLPEDFREKYRSVWVDIPSSLYDPVRGHEVYNDYLDQLEFAETVGFDGLGVNEHHANAYGLMPSPTLMAAALARRTSRAALVVLGSSIALYEPPIRVAEEFAMLDVLSGGRLVAGFPVGTSMDTNYAYGRVPATLRERYAEAHDLIRRAWAADEPFIFNGRFTQLRYANCWPKPVQKPRPPIFIPGGGSVETYDFCIENDYNYSYLSFFGYLRAQKLMANYWQRVAEMGADDSPYRATFAQCICVAETDAEAERLYGPHVSYFFNRCLHVYPGFADAPGYRTIKTIQAGFLNQLSRANLGHAATLSWQELIELGYIVAGSPETVRQRMEELIKGLRVGNIICLFQMGDMPTEKTCHSSELFARKVMPHLKGIWKDYGGDERFWIQPLPQRGHARPGYSGDPAMSSRSFLLDVAGSRRKIRVFEAGDGPPLVFLHGAGGLVEESPFLAALAQRWHVFAPLLPGYGDSEGGDTLPDMLAITLHSFDVIEALGLARPYLVGHSMGGMIAAEMAAVAPHDIERLGLIAPAGLWLDDHPIPDLFATLPHELPELLFHDPALGERLMAPDGDLDNPKLLEAFMIRNARQLTMASKLLFPVPDRGLAERLYRIQARTVIVWGEDDRMIPPAYGEAFRRGVAGTELVMVPAAGHMVIVEKAESVVAALARLD